MPKFSKIQTNFTAGEVSQGVWGRIDNEKYDQAVRTMFNYTPLLQGPVVRRPGTKFVGTVKDSQNPPILVPFKVSETQSYTLEMGNNYIRFYTTEGQVLTSGSSILVQGLAFNPLYLPRENGNSTSYGTFYSVRQSVFADNTESITSTSAQVSGSIMEMGSPYKTADLPKLKWSQKEDTLYFTHPSFRPFKLQKLSNTNWKLTPAFLRDGPYQPLNTVDSIGDAATTWLKPTTLTAAFGIKQGSGALVDLMTGSSCLVTDHSTSGSGYFRLQVPSNHPFSNGDKIAIYSFGNDNGYDTDNGTNPSYWLAQLVGSSFIDIQKERTAIVPYAGSSRILPYVFKTSDVGRLVSVANAGGRYWGMITNFFNGGYVRSVMCTPLPNDNTAVVWQLGAFSGSSYPSASCFHQNRLYFVGSPNQPEEIDGSVIGDYDNFAASGSNYQVADNNAVQFKLLSNDVNPLKWIRPSAQGLLAASLSGEWQVSPSNLATGITPTNVTAQQISAFGTADVDAVTFGNAVLYLQKAQRKVRELNYFFQAGTFKSTNLSELSEHLTLPSISQLVVQKEINPLIWGLRSDGQLISLTYSRDEVTVKAGWARHQLGGQSDNAGSPPVVKSMSIASASSALFEELWLTVRRSIANSTVVTVEYMARPFDYSTLQEDAYYLDCGATYDSPVAVQAITNASTCVITANNHGFANSSTVRFYSAVGLNSSVVDINGNTTITNAVNGNTFVVASSSTNSFKLQDFLGNDINTVSYNAYLGSAVVRKLVTTITGLSWLANETVSVLTDGGIHVNTTVSSTGSLSLAYPAAKVHIGYGYNSDLELLRTKDGSAQGSSIGSTRRVNRVAVMYHNIAELSIGPTLTNLLPVEFQRATVQNADSPTALGDGIFREGFQGPYTFDDNVSIRQSAPLPGMIQAVVRFVEETDV